MTWVKLDDRAMLHPKLRAVGPKGITAWLCALSAAASIETDGVLTDEDVYPHWSGFGGRQGLRAELHKLERAGLVHFQSGTEGEMEGERIVSARNRRKKPITFSIHDYTDYQFSGEQKAQRKRAARERQQRHRAKVDKPASRRDSSVSHAPPEPEPDPEPLSKESNCDVASAPKPSKISEEVGQVWEHYLDSELVADRKRTKLNKKREAKIRARLKEGYEVADLKAAIDGIQHSGWHMGQNDEGKRFTDLATILRDGAQVEKFRDLEANPPKGKGLSRDDLEAERNVKANHEHSAEWFAQREEDERKAHVPTAEEMAEFDRIKAQAAAEQREKNGGPNPLGKLIELDSAAWRGR